MNDKSLVTTQAIVNRKHRRVISFQVEPSNAFGASVY